MLLYILIGFPIVLSIFIHFARKKMDIQFDALFAMTIVSIIPIMREFIALVIMYEELKFKNILNRVAFKKYKD